LTPEEWGGDTVICPISCKTGEGIDNLLETLILTAEMKELLANPAREARGVVIEARLDKGQGPVATVLVQNGTLRTGDNLVTGTVTGKVRAMIDDKGKTVKEAGPSMAVNVLGLESVPNSGDAINAVSKELMKQVQAERADKLSAEKLKGTPKLPVGDEWGDGGELKNLNVIIKGDVQGSVEAVKQSVLKLTNDEVQIKVIHSAAGAVNESDVMLAESSKAIILAFNVRPDPKAKALAERSKVDVRTYRIIYDLLDEMELAMKGLRAPKYQDILLGKCEVRQTFKITGVGNIAGCYVLDGKIIRGGKLRIYRDNILIVEGGVKQLKRFKDDVKEVAAGFECGCAIEGFNDIKMGDIIECYLIEEVKV
ncbi:MAG: translation initiation factor IF-2, partial [Clostridia bacterium]|nr:translation initiation factor IF-2 [Clostridia bacterium]